MNDEYGTAQAHSLPDVPDLSGITPDEHEPWEDGWYKAEAVAERQFTSRDTGVTSFYKSEDALSQKGDSRNISIQVKVKRKNGDVLNGRVLVNYKPEFLTSEYTARILQHKEAQKAAKQAGAEVPDLGELFIPFMNQMRVGTLQRVAGVRQFVRNGGGGLDISPVFGKTLFVRLAPQKDKPQFKEVKEFSDTAPKRSPIL